MNEQILRIIIACSLFLVYFILLYLFFVKMSGQSQYKWLILALLQVGSLFSIKYLELLAKKFEFTKDLTIDLIFYILLGINAAILLIINFVLMVKEIGLHKKKIADYKKVTESSLSTRIRTMSTSTSGGEESSSIVDEESILSQIEGIIESGRNEEAVKALREFITYARNKTTVDKATLMLRRLQTIMERND